VRTFAVWSEVGDLLKAARDSGAQAALFTSEPLAGTNAENTSRIAFSLGLPAMFEQPAPARDGRALFGYGADEDEHWARVVALVDRVLRGAKPAELAVERPTRFGFVAHLTGAQGL